MTEPGGRVKNNRACGSRFELQCKKDALAYGVEAEKRFMSGQLDGGGDLHLTAAWGENWDGECKSKRARPTPAPSSTGPWPKTAWAKSSRGFSRGHTASKKKGIIYLTPELLTYAELIA